MITDINSLVSGQGKASTAQSSSTASLGNLAKLSSELKLINGLNSIQITSVRNAQTPNGTQQLIGVSSPNNQQQFTLVNNQPSPAFQAGDKGTLSVSANQATLTVTTPQSSTSTSAQTVSNNRVGYNTGQQTTPSFNQSSTQTAQTSSANVHSSNTTLISSSSTQATTNNASSASQGAVSQNTSVQQAQTIAQVAIASRPITLTVISSDAITLPQQGTSNNNSASASAKTINVQSSISQPVASASTTVTPSRQDGASNTQPSNVQPTPSVAATKPNTPSNLPNASVIPATPSNTTNNAITAPTAQPAAANFSAIVSDGNEQFKLTTQHPLTPGEKLTVVVDKQGQMQFLPPEKTNAPPVTLSDGLRQSMPKQITAQELVSMVRQLHTLSQSGAALPEKVATALDQLVKQLPNLQTLTQTSEGVKQAILSSGLFSESNLAKSTNLTTDFKLNLSRLEGASVEASTQAAPSVGTTTSSQQAIQLVTGAIERITTSQVRHLIENAQQDGSVLPLSVEIPIKDGRTTSIVNLKIDQDKSDKDNNIEPHKRRWLVQLKFDFEETGRFEARASVQDKKVGVIFAVEDPSTEKIIRERLDELRTNLRNKHVEIETLDCFRATLQDKPNQYKEDKPQRLIDVRT